MGGEDERTPGIAAIALMLLGLMPLSARSAAQTPRAPVLLFNMSLQNGTRLPLGQNSLELQMSTFSTPFHAQRAGCRRLNDHRTWLRQFVVVCPNALVNSRTASASTPNIRVFGITLPFSSQWVYSKTSQHR